MITARRSVDPGAVAALTWLSIAVGVTLVFGPMLGLRGWVWLGAHHVLCVVGSSHELWRARRRARARRARHGRPASGSPAG